MKELKELASHKVCTELELISRFKECYFCSYVSAELGITSDFVTSFFVKDIYRPCTMYI